ncbi:MAG: DUF3795 domain-containing protein, partial [Candidatus Sabulitectum sp.]|nr:DUF3795 domain-containing protein [Candidatus Sabulitectum sp.]
MRRCVLKLIAICGLDCSECPARLAYMSNDEALRKKTALEWSGLYGADIKPEQVNCTGCTASGVKFPHCENGCFMRKCAIGKQIEHCGLCSDYPCEELSAFFVHVPSAKET